MVLGTNNPKGKKNKGSLNVHLRYLFQFKKLIAGTLLNYTLMNIPKIDANVKFLNAYIPILEIYF
jgi:hypothetical protein